MVCLGLEPRSEGWKTQTNPLSYGGTPAKFKFIFGHSDTIWRRVHLNDNNCWAEIFHEKKNEEKEFLSEKKFRNRPWKNGNGINHVHVGLVGLYRFFSQKIILSIHECARLMVVASVTRCVNISSLWRKFKSLGQIFRVNLVFGKILILLWQKCDPIGLVFIFVDGQIFQNNLAIWSHWQWWTWHQGIPTVRLVSIVTGLNR